MKKNVKFMTYLLAASMLLSSCGYSTVSGLMAGSSLGGMIGGAAGWLRGGPRGHDRGTAIGILTGAAATGALMAAKEIKSNSNKSDYQQDNYAYSNTTSTRSNTKSTQSQAVQITGSSSIRLQNLTFTNAQGAYAESITRNEDCVIDFELYNNTTYTINNIEPVIYESSGNKQIGFSPSARIASLTPGSTAHYSAIVRGMPRLKNGEATLVIAISEDGSEYKPMQSITITTKKK